MTNSAALGTVTRPVTTIMAAAAAAVAALATATAMMTMTAIKRGMTKRTAVSNEREPNQASW